MPPPMSSSGTLTVKSGQVIGIVNAAHVRYNIMVTKREG